MYELARNVSRNPADGSVPKARADRKQAYVHIADGARVVLYKARGYQPGGIFWCAENF